VSGKLLEAEAAVRAQLAALQLLLVAVLVLQERLEMVGRVYQIPSLEQR
jgi:hypothetical protein